MTAMPATTDNHRAERIHHPDPGSFDLATIMRALADPQRLEMVRLLGDGSEWLCGDLTKHLGLPTSTGSYHVKLLREAGLTRSRAAGTQRLISLRREDLEARFPGLVEVVTRPA
jgi:DNA-binding transcriptional ArsR family regulator